MNGGLLIQEIAPGPSHWETLADWSEKLLGVGEREVAFEQAAPRRDNCELVVPSRSGSLNQGALAYASLAHEEKGTPNTAPRRVDRRRNGAESLVSFEQGSGRIGGSEDWEVPRLHETIMT